MGLEVLVQGVGFLLPTPAIARLAPGAITTLSWSSELGTSTATQAVQQVDRLLVWALVIHILSWVVGDLSPCLKPPLSGWLRTSSG
jgi:hypothetical protein